ISNLEYFRISDLRCLVNPITASSRSFPSRPDHSIIITMQHPRLRFLPAIGLGTLVPWAIPAAEPGKQDPAAAEAKYTQAIEGRASDILTALGLSNSAKST